MDKELCAALVAVQSKFRGIQKEGRNPAFNSRYMTLDTILDTIRPLLVENGLVITQNIPEKHYNPEGRLVCIIMETVVHHVNGGAYAISIPIPVVKPDAQGVGGCLTYGRRYSLCALLMISADDDLDGNDAVIVSTVKPTQKLPPLTKDGTAWK